ncbi:FecR family protein [Flagellimonas sp.]|uniref:FecR family protein n=1 Tax=Flagellimonas sp. TaxID=2058762 RepID=UPI003B50E558
MKHLDKMSENIAKIIAKFLMNAINSDELEILTDWLKEPVNKQIFKSYVRINYAMDMNFKQFDIENAKKEYLEKLRRDKSIFYRYKLNTVLKYAAVLAGVIVSMYISHVILTENQLSEKTDIVKTIQPGTDKATLTLEDGSQIVLEKGTSFKTQNINSNGQEIVYGSKNHNSDKVVYNYLTIPRGGQFFLKLSDGTKIWLNSDSRLKYPVSFVEGEARVVELIYGEAYFDVSPSAVHDNSNFKVYNSSQEIEVLGTEFNVKAYKDETNVYTTLVEGNVTVTFEGGKENLMPSQQSNLNTLNNSLVVAKIDVYNEISWKEGVFSFDGKKLKEMMKVISRWYDVDVVFKEKTIENEEFVGVLRKNQKLEGILTNIKNFGIIKNFKIEDDKVVIE